MSTLMTRARYVPQFCGVLAISLTSPFCHADHGGVGCAAVPQEPSNQTGSDVSLIAEPAQRAVILWNGGAERLILSTDVALVSGSSTTDSLAEFIPLPGRPVVAPMPIDVFGKLVKSASRVNVDLSALLPLKPLGSMPGTLDIEQIERPTALIDLLNRKCEIQRSYVEPTMEIVQRYLDRGDSWFVIDKIVVGDSVRSYPPIVYEFPTKQLFYPLDTSTMAFGETRIDIVTITPNGISKFGELSTSIQMHSTFSVDRGTLDGVSPDWPTFFDQDTLVVQHWSFQGKLSDMRLDLRAR
jgi:hypothetical protein